MAVSKCVVFGLCLVFVYHLNTQKVTIFGKQDLYIKTNELPIVECSFYEW